ncbi:hypothetical protein GGR50DRAFT_628789 [Xylaria sp. CBS 124048]|nr:hypothetical protein GGR50DRAFT_628789 [Xylaria sp. CBS 124048]
MASSLRRCVKGSVAYVCVCVPICVCMPSSRGYPIYSAAFSNPPKMCKSADVSVLEWLVAHPNPYLHSAKHFLAPPSNLPDQTEPLVPKCVHSYAIGPLRRLRRHVLFFAQLLCPATYLLLSRYEHPYTEIVQSGGHDSSPRVHEASGKETNSVSALSRHILFFRHAATSASQAMRDGLAVTDFTPLRNEPVESPQCLLSKGIVNYQSVGTTLRRWLCKGLRAQNPEPRTRNPEHPSRLPQYDGYIIIPMRPVDGLI